MRVRVMRVVGCALLLAGCNHAAVSGEGAVAVPPLPQRESFDADATRRDVERAQGASEELLLTEQLAGAPAVRGAPGALYAAHVATNATLAAAHAFLFGQGSATSAPAGNLPATADPS